MVEWLFGDDGPVFRVICYCFAGIVALWGVTNFLAALAAGTFLQGVVYFCVGLFAVSFSWAAVVKLIRDKHETWRVYVGMCIAAVCTTLLSLYGSFIPTLLAGGV